VWVRTAHGAYSIALACTLGRMARTYIHVNQHVIRRNHTTGQREAVLTVKRGRTNVYAMAAEVLGPCRVVYSPECPLSCGARVWIETEAEVRLEGVTGPPAPRG